MSFSIEEADRGRSFRDFLELPFRLYTDEPNWVPPVRHFNRQMFDTSKHPFHEHASVRLFLARDGTGAPVGRVCSIENRTHNEYHHEKTGFFGFFETEKDPGIAAALLGAVEADQRDRGMDRVRGPASFSTNEECGLLVKGFDDPPLIMMPYNPPWYGELLEDCGYRKTRDLYAYYMDADKTDYSRLSRIAERLGSRPGLHMRDLSVKHISRDIPVIMDIYNECWRENWGFVPMSKRELDMMADELKMILVPELAPIVEKDGIPVAFAVALPDANQAFMKAGGGLLRTVLALKVPLFKVRIDRVRVLLLGVRRAYRGRGLEALMIDRIIRESSRLGMGRGEMSWILEDNLPMRKILERILGAEHYRTYRILEKELNGGEGVPHATPPAGRTTNDLG